MSAPDCRSVGCGFKSRRPLAVMLMAVVLLSSLALAQGQQSARPPLPVLEVWCDNNPQCRAFWNEYNQGGEFARMLNTRCQVRHIPIRENQIPAFVRGIRCSPTFVLHQRIVLQGYRAPRDVLVAIGLNPQDFVGEQAPPDSRLPPPADLTAVREELAEALLVELERTQKRLRADLDASARKRDEELAGQLRSILGRLNQLEQAHDPQQRLQLEEQIRIELANQGGRLSILEGSQRQLEQALTPLPSPADHGRDHVRPPDHGSTVEPANPPQRSANERESFWFRSIRFLGMTATLAQWVAGAGVVTGTPLGMLFLVPRVLSWWKRRRTRKRDERQSEDRTAPVPHRPDSRFCSHCEQADGVARSVRDENQRLLHRKQELDISLRAEQQKTAELEDERDRLEQALREFRERYKALERQYAQLQAQQADATNAGPLSLECPTCDSLGEQNRQLTEERERLKVEIQTLKTQQRLRESETKYIRVPVMNREAEALKEAMRRETNVNRGAVPVVARIQSVAKELLHGWNVREKQRVDDAGEHQALSDA